MDIIDAVKDALENTPPELAADLPGAASCSPGEARCSAGFAERLQLETHVPVSIADDPLTCVVLGAGHALEEFDVLERAASRAVTTEIRYSPRKRRLPSLSVFTSLRKPMYAARSSLLRSPSTSWAFSSGPKLSSMKSA